MKIAIIIPTHNRIENIINFINKCYMVYEGNLFSIYILDSSTDCKIRDYIDSINTNKITYIKFNSNEKPDEKMIRVLPLIKEDYFYVIGDTFSIDLTAFEKKLIEVNYNDYSVICIAPKSSRFAKKNRNNSMEWINKTAFVNDNASLMTLYGAVMIKTIFYVENGGLTFLNDLFLRFGDSYCFQASICSSIKKSDNNKFIRLFPESITSWPNPAKRLHWTETIRFFTTAFETFQNTYSNVYNISDDDLKIIYKNYYKNDWNSFRFRSLLKKRYIKIINISNVKKYKFYLKKAKIYYRVLFICFIPNFILKFVYKLFGKGV